MTRKQEVERILPGFVGVGPPRTGTTWLHEILKEHASLPRGNNETRFFDLHYSKGLRWYAAHFDASSRLPRGEMCSPYFYSGDARKRIAELIPEAKIICTFRNPVERVFSLYRAKRAGGLIPWSFEEALRRDRELLESSRYAFHLSKWQTAFGANNVLAAICDDLAQDPQAYVDRIVDFLGIPRFPLGPSSHVQINSAAELHAPRNYQWTRMAAKVAQWLRTHRLTRLVSAIKNSAISSLVLGGGPVIVAPEPNILEQLRKLLDPEIEQLEAMIDRDLSFWRSSRP